MPEAFTHKMGQLPTDYAYCSVLPLHSEESHMYIPTFVFAHYLLRNITTNLDTDESSEAYNSVVDLNHEFILEMCLTATIKANIPIFALII